MSAQKWIIVLLLTGLVISTASVAVSAQKPVGTVTITSPPKNSTVGPNESVSGRAQLPSGYTLWVMPYDGIAGRWYPQGAPVTIRDDATWSSRLSFGSIPVGQKFQIQAVATDRSANSDFNSFVSSGQKGGTTKLPAGAQAVESITVTRGASSNTSSTSPSASPSMIPIVTQNVSTTTSTSNVVQASASASSSQSLLPGFEAIYALGALAIALVLVFKGRLSK